MKILLLTTCDSKNQFIDKLNLRDM
jgi:hypothetical protein